jgi:hypothetical protein
MQHDWQQTKLRKQLSKQPKICAGSKLTELQQELLEMSMPTVNKKKARADGWRERKQNGRCI